MIELSEDQEQAVEAIKQWRKWPDKPFLTLGGLAGTGKTTIVSYLADLWGDAAVCTLAGKAASVHREKGTPATTIHTLIYIPWVDMTRRPRFRRRPYLDRGVVIVDEASMVDHVLLQDLLAFKVPVLFVGDHGQLEPIGTNPNLMKSPDVRLERIHRQAMGNPILRLAAAFREGRPTPYWAEDSKDRLVLTRRWEFEKRLDPEAQIICGYNKTRHRVNQIIRKARGFDGLVKPGERLICLKNNCRWNLFNGQQVTVADRGRHGKRVIDLTIQTDDGRVLTVECLTEQFGREFLRDFRSDKVILLDYGYCVTAHKAQGSEWPYVIALEEITSSWDPRRWRYTVVTRAKERLVYCK
jgi:exodeoxyribonuclease-5